jgi:predicted dinucleotide-binding enzyme
MNIAFIGIGQVGSALAGQLVGLGHTVTIAARDRNSDKVKAALAKYPNLQVAAISEAIATAEIVFLATPFSANKTAMAEAGDLSGKILVDCTNPVGAGFTHGLNNKQSGGEFVQNLVPQC